MPMVWSVVGASVVAGFLLGAGLAWRAARRLAAWRDRVQSATALLDQGQAELADQLAASVQVEAAGVLPDTHRLVLDVAVTRARALLALGRPDEAEAPIKRAFELRRHRPELDEAADARLLQLLARCLAGQGRVLEAAPVAEQALEAGARGLPRGDARLGDLHFTRGQCLQAVGDLAGALPQYRRALELLPEDATDPARRAAIEAAIRSLGAGPGAPLPGGAATVN